MLAVSKPALTATGSDADTPTLVSVIDRFFSLALLFAAGLLAACAVPPKPEATEAANRAAAECAMAPADAAWLSGAIAKWRIVAREKLLIAPDPLPSIIVADANCQYVSRPQPGGDPGWPGQPHDGTIRLPDGTSHPLNVTAFAKPLGEGEDGFFMMALPSVWRAQGITSDLGLERLLDGVLLHEMMHAYQFYFANPRLADILRRHDLPETTGDDSLQEAFKSNPDYVALYSMERDMLYRAARAPDEPTACQAARRSLQLMASRRARFLDRDQRYWTDLDDIFLLMEGVGQWAMYAWYTDPRGGGLARETAIKEVRRGGRWWTQDEGLALFLTIDRLLPDWQKLAFGRPPLTAEPLLARAIERCSASTQPRPR